MVVVLRYYRGMTQDKAAKVIGISQVQVSRLERAALQKLKRRLG
jgi:RNA polymerase sporulation-specific sigma factor